VETSVISTAKFKQKSENPAPQVIRAPRVQSSYHCQKFL